MRVVLYGAIAQVSCRLYLYYQYAIVLPYPCATIFKFHESLLALMRFSTTMLLCGRLYDSVLVGIGQPLTNLAWMSRLNPK